VRLDESGQVLVRSPATMMGYNKDKKATSEALTEDGYLRTGDMGTVDAEGYLTVTGRTKDLFKTNKGKYVVPGPIEQRLGSAEWIEYVCVMGSELDQPLAVVTLSQTGLSSDALKKSVRELLASVNPALDAHERLSKIVVLKDHWTIDNGVLTPTLKVRRMVLEKRYATHFSKWAEQTGTFVLDEGTYA
jgi:long-subunit acyl-CoA synthetase (AMP-forming)